MGCFSVEAASEGMQWHCTHLQLLCQACALGLQHCSIAPRCCRGPSRRAGRGCWLCQALRRLRRQRALLLLPLLQLLQLLLCSSQRSSQLIGSCALGGRCLLSLAQLLLQLRHLLLQRGSLLLSFVQPALCLLAAAGNHCRSCHLGRLRLLQRRLAVALQLLDAALQLIRLLLRCCRTLTGLSSRRLRCSQGRLRSLGPRLQLLLLLDCRHTIAHGSCPLAGGAAACASAPQPGQLSLQLSQLLLPPSQRLLQLRHVGLRRVGDGKQRGSQ